MKTLILDTFEILVVLILCEIVIHITKVKTGYFSVNTQFLLLLLDSYII